MVLVPDPIVIINLMLCLVILFLGVVIYQKSNDVNALLIGIAFGLFGLSHLNTLLGLSLFPEITFALLRICGYILVAVALYGYLKK
jgi:TctA family transporter